MQINNIFAKTSIISKNNIFAKTSNNKLATKIQNSIVSKNKDKKKAEMDKINETLNKPSQSNVLSTVCSLNDLYEPVEEYFKGLSFFTKNYEACSDALKGNNLSEDDKKALQNFDPALNLNNLSENDKKMLQTTMNLDEKVILYETSSNCISGMDQYINSIKPNESKLISSFGAQTNENISSIAINSVEQFGITPTNNFTFEQIFGKIDKPTYMKIVHDSENHDNNITSTEVLKNIGGGVPCNEIEVSSGKYISLDQALKSLNNNMTFDQVLNEVKKSENKFYKNVVTKLDDINFKYGDVNNKDFVKKLDMDSYEIDTYA